MVSGYVKAFSTRLFTLLNDIWLMSVFLRMRLQKGVFGAFPVWRLAIGAESREVGNACELALRCHLLC